MRGQRAGDDVGRMCFSCGFCFAHGTHRYAVSQYLPEEWKFTGATFLVCASCGTAHAIEHSAEEGVPDRLRARCGPLHVPLSPKTRREYQELIGSHKHLNRPFTQPERQAYERYINLLPPPRWKVWANNASDTLFNLVVKGVFFIPFCCFYVPVLIFEMIQDEIWDRGHSLQDWQKRNPIWVTSPETCEKRIQQILEFHQNYEALWPVVVEQLPVRETDEEADSSVKTSRYTDLTCSYCGVLGSLMDNLPDSATPQFPYFPMPDCPCCKRNSVQSDLYSDIETSLYLMGDILADKRLWKHEWTRHFSSYSAPRSEAVFLFENGGPIPLLLTHSSLGTDELQIWVHPGRTYETHIKTFADESHRSDSSLAHWGPYEVVAVFDDGQQIYSTE